MVLFSNIFCLPVYWILSIVAGDSKDVVRESSQGVLQALMADVISPTQLFEKLATIAFSHKNGRIREEVMYCLQNTLKEWVKSIIIFFDKLLANPVRTLFFFIYFEFFAIVDLKPFLKLL